MADAQVLEVEGPNGPRQVRLSSPDRVMWPDAGITKGDLAAYVVAVGDPLLHHIGDRPVTLQRFPGGIEGEEFYQKNPPKGMPDWVHTVSCRYPSGRRHAQIVVDEVATAVWAVQMNTVTFHPWPVRSANNDNPDELRIDLDPQPGRTFQDSVEAALALRELMAEIGLTAFAKTSGNRGVHVYARVAPTHEFLEVRHGVIGIARELERRLPDLGITHRRTTISTVGWMPGLRRFVDDVTEPVRLAVSVHAADPALRSRLMPVNDRYPLEDVLSEARRYYELRRRKVFVEYVMLAGVNDSPADARLLAALLDGRIFKVNLIPYNPTDSIYEGSSPEAIDAFRAVLEEHGVRATVRLTRGRDIAAACGQLAATQQA